MAITKQDEALLHEILRKYKQGLIFGLIEGENTTLTNYGCRNKIISSSGGGGGGGDAEGENGLSGSGTIKLGGTLTEDTTISLDGNQLTIGGEDGFIEVKPEVVTIGGVGAEVFIQPENNVTIGANGTVALGGSNLILEGGNVEITAHTNLKLNFDTDVDLKINDDAGESGQVFTSNGEGQNPSWENIAESFRIANNFVIVTESRDFNTNDLDKILVVVANDVELTLPSGEWAEGFHNIIILPLGVDNLSYQSTFGGAITHVFTPTGTGGETKLLITTIPPPGGQTTLLDIGQGDLLDANDSLKKTTIRYIMDNLNGFIPLAGTTTGHEVISTVYFKLDDGTNGISFNNYDNQNTLNLSAGGDNGTLTCIDGNNTNNLTIYTHGSIQVYKDGFTSTVLNFPKNYIASDTIVTAGYLEAHSGPAVLVSGTVTIANSDIKTGSRVFVSYDTFSGTTGSLSAPSASIIDGVSFVINSSSATDNSSVYWWIAP